MSPIQNLMRFPNQPADTHHRHQWDYGDSLLNTLIPRLLSVIDNLTPFTIALHDYNLLPWLVLPALLSLAFLII